MPTVVISYSSDPAVQNLFAAVSVSLSAGEIQMSYQGLLLGQLVSDSRFAGQRASAPSCLKASCNAQYCSSVPTKLIVGFPGICPILVSRTMPRIAVNTHLSIGT